MRAIGYLQGFAKPFGSKQIPGGEKMASQQLSYAQGASETIYQTIGARFDETAAAKLNVVGSS